MVGARRAFGQAGIRSSGRTPFAGFSKKELPVRSAQPNRSVPVWRRQFVGLAPCGRRLRAYPKHVTLTCRPSLLLPQRGNHGQPLQAEKAETPPMIPRQSGGRSPQMKLSSLTAPRGSSREPTPWQRDSRSERSGLRRGTATAAQSLRTPSVQDRPRNRSLATA